MKQVQDLTPDQLNAYQEFIRPDSNWPQELREKFEAKCSAADGYHPYLDQEVIGEYVKEKFA